MCTIIRPVSIFDIFRNTFSLQAGLTLILNIADDVYLCNGTGCGLKRSTSHINMSIIIRQLLLLRQNGQKKKDLTDSEKSKVAKSLSKGCCATETAKTLGFGHRSKHFVANCQQGDKKSVEKKKKKKINGQGFYKNQV